jgi:Tfp pilus assembly protein PilV
MAAMKTPLQCQPLGRSRGGYSLVEVIIAGFLLVIAISGAAILARTIAVNEESNTVVARAINTQEQAARLYALGLSPTQITNILPEVFTTNTAPAEQTLNLSFATTNTTITNVGVLEAAVSTLIYPVGQNANGVALFRTNIINIVRPSIR